MPKLENGNQTSASGMETMSHRLTEQHPDDEKSWGAVVVPPRDQMVGNIRSPELEALRRLAMGPVAGSCVFWL
jgi:hypothetical protein